MVTFQQHTGPHYVDRIKTWAITLKIPPLLVSVHLVDCTHEKFHSFPKIVLPPAAQVSEQMPLWETFHARIITPTIIKRHSIIYRKVDVVIVQKTTG